jgi:hypothetical protein
MIERIYGHHHPDYMRAAATAITAKQSANISGRSGNKACEGGCEVTLDLRFDGWLGRLAGLLQGRLAECYVRCEAEGLKARSQSSLQAYARG